MITRFLAWRRAFVSMAFIGTVFLGTLSEVKAASLYYWDTNGSTSGAGGTSPNGTWGEDPNWNPERNGTATTETWTDDNHAVFAALGDATGSYTVTVVGTKNVGDIHFDYGTPTLSEGTIALTDGDRLISADSGVIATLNSVLTSKGPNGVTKLTKYKMGTLVLGGANTYSGATMIEGGTLRMGASERIPNGSQLILGNGDTRTGDGFADTPATFSTGGFNETLGTLKLTGPSAFIPRTLDFGHGSSALVFANSSGEDWEGIPLTIVNYTSGVDSLRFGTSNSGLNSTQLDSIMFADFGNLPGVIDANGFVTPALPNILEVTGAGTANTVISWQAISGRTYRVQYKNSLSEATWNDLFPDVYAFGSTESTTDDTSSGNARYYRVILLP